MSTSTAAPSSTESDVELLDALDELIAEVANLQSSIVEELLARRAWLCRELASVDSELADLEETSAPEKKPRTKTATGDARKLPLTELIAELEAAPEHTLNIRKAHLDVKHTKALVKKNPQRLQLGGKTGWPTVTLVAARAEEAPSAPETPQGMFTFDETSPEAEEKAE